MSYLDFRIQEFIQSYYSVILVKCGHFQVQKEVQNTGKRFCNHAFISIKGISGHSYPIRNKDQSREGWVFYNCCLRCSLGVRPFFFAYISSPPRQSQGREGHTRTTRHTTPHTHCPYRNTSIQTRLQNSSIILYQLHRCTMQKRTFTTPALITDMLRIRRCPNTRCWPAPLLSNSRTQRGNEPVEAKV